MNKTQTIALSLLMAIAATTLPAAQASDSKPAAAKAGHSAAANKALVLKAYQALFGDHDLSAVDRYLRREAASADQAVHVRMGERAKEQR